VRVFSEGIPRTRLPSSWRQIRSLAAEYDSPSRQLARFVAEVAGWEKTEFAASNGVQAGPVSCAAGITRRSVRRVSGGAVHGARWRTIRVSIRM